MRSLQKILFQHLSFILAIFIFLSSISGWIQHKSLLNYFKNIEIEKSITLANSLEATVIFESKQDFNNTFKNNNNVDVLVLGTNEQVLFSKGSKIDHHQFQDKANWKDDFLVTKTDILTNNTTLATLYLKTSSKRIYSLSKIIALYILLSLLLLSIIFIIISRKIDIKIVSPINSLNNLMKEILQKNDLSIRVPLIAPSIEIKELSLSFNSLLHNLDQNNDRLIDLNLNLEQNISEKTKELERVILDLKKSQDQVIAQEKLAALGSLTAGVAHEIKNPLNLINNSASIIQKVLNSVFEKNQKFLNDNTSDDKTVIIPVSDLELASKFSEIIIKNGNRTDEIIKSMLRLSRNKESSGSSQSLNSISLLVKSSLNFTLNAMMSMPNSIHVEIEKDLENLIETKCFPLDLERAFVNILENSFYAMKKKTVESQNEQKEYIAKLKLSVTFEEETIEVNIWDNGSGIKDDSLTKILEPFYTTKPPGEGTGLGMAMVNDIISAHRGELKVSSSIGQFTEVNISFPIKL